VLGQPTPAARQKNGASTFVWQQTPDESGQRLRGGRSGPSARNWDVSVVNDGNFGETACTTGIPVALGGATQAEAQVNMQELHFPWWPCD
jgi:hypothetical protein